MTKVKTGGNLIDYVMFDDNAPFTKFLTKLDIIQHTSGWPNSLHIILNQNVSSVSHASPSNANMAVMDKYTNNGVFLEQTVAGIPAPILFPRINIASMIGDSPCQKARLSIGTFATAFELSNNDFVTDLSNWTQPNSSTTTDDWAFVGGLAQRKQESQSSIAILSHAIDLSPRTPIRIRSQWQGFILSNYVMKAYVTQSGTPYLLGSFAIDNTVSIKTVDSIFQIPDGVGATHFDSVYFTIEGAEATGNKVSVYYFDLSTTYTTTSEFKNILINDECENPVLVYFRNSLGGDTFWMFNHNQSREYTITIKRADRKLLYAENLTLNQWEALSDMNNLNAVYSEVINDLQQVNKTSKMVGQQVYVFDKDGEKTGVITIPTANNTITKTTLHSFEMQIEYPEYFVQ